VDAWATYGFGFKGCPYIFIISGEGMNGGGEDGGSAVVVDVVVGLVSISSDLSATGLGPGSSTRTDF